MKLYIHLVEVPMEGIMCQIFYLGPSFNFMQCRKWGMKKCLKVTRFFK